MKSIFSKLKKSILFYTILFTMLILLLKLTLNLFDFEFIGWIYILTYIVFFTGILLGTAQLIVTSKMTPFLKWITSITSIILHTLVIIVITYIFLLFDIFPNERVEGSIVIKKSSTLRTVYTHYKYVNFIVRGTEEIYSYKK